MRRNLRTRKTPASFDWVGKSFPQAFKNPTTTKWLELIRPLNLSNIKNWVLYRQFWTKEVLSQNNERIKYRCFEPKSPVSVKAKWDKNLSHFTLINGFRLRRHCLVLPFFDLSGWRPRTTEPFVTMYGFNVGQNESKCSIHHYSTVHHILLVIYVQRFLPWPVNRRLYLLPKPSLKSFQLIWYTSP